MSLFVRQGVYVCLVISNLFVQCVQHVQVEMGEIPLATFHSMKREEYTGRCASL